MRADKLSCLWMDRRLASARSAQQHKVCPAERKTESQYRFQEIMSENIMALVNLDSSPYSTSFGNRVAGKACFLIGRKNGREFIVLSAATLVWSSADWPILLSKARNLFYYFLKIRLLCLTP